MILVIQRLYVYGLKRADPFVSATTICTIVPLSLGAEIIFERRMISTVEALLCVAYVASNLLLVRLNAHLETKVGEILST